MASLACRNCGRLLTHDCEWGTSGQRDLSVGDRASPVARGLLVRMQEDRVPLLRGMEQVGTHLYSPAGAIAVHPQTVVPGVLVSTGTDNGCCGSDGCDGPNRACSCGNVVATEWSDCWTFAEVRFLPDAILEVL